jgi:hypothetical protein
MCCHRLYIHTTCGHSLLSPTPLIECRHASIEPSSTRSTTCEIIAHPYQSWKIESLCPPCQQQRDVLMSRIEATQTVKFDEWRWKVSYGMPTHGKDFWGKRADERVQREEEEREGKRSTKFGLKRRSIRRSGNGNRWPALSRKG